MSANLISLGSLLVAFVAMGVSYFTYRVQRRTQDSTDEQTRNDLRQKMNDLIEKIESNLATVAKPQTSFNLETFAAQNSALTVMQGQALEAKSLACENGFELDWFKNMVLASAFSQTWDLAASKPFWDEAVNRARTPQARIRSLTARAELYYNRGLHHEGHDDWQLARADYLAALDELREDADGQGPDLVANQAAGMELYQAGFEFTIGNDSMAVSLVANAFGDANSISAPGRKLAALDRLGDLVRVMESQVLPPPKVWSKLAAELSRRGIGLETFPQKTKELLSMPPDGSQLSGRFGEDV